MFKRRLAAALLFFQTLHATIQDPGVEASTEGDPSSSLCESVSLMTGDFVAHSEDLVIQGRYPLSIKRTYVSGNNEGKYGGWDFFPHLEMRTVPYKRKSRKYRRIIVREPNGTRLVFKKEGKNTIADGWVKFTIDFAKNGKGITNTSRGPISGRTSLRNYTLYQTGEQTYILCCADGTKRHYTYARNDRSEKEMPIFLLQEETHPDGHRTIYNYNKKQQLIGIRNTTKSGCGTYAACTITYDVKDMRIKTTDGRQLSYRLHSIGKKKKDRRYYLDDVDGPELPHESIEYESEDYSVDHLIQARKLPDNRQVFVKYNVRNRVKTLYQSLGENGALEATHHFSYHKERDKPGSTDVHDAEGNKSTLYYSASFLPEAIHYHNKETLDHIVKMVWDVEGKLCEKIVANADGEPLLTKSYRYDKRGNILEEKIIGNITEENSFDIYSILQQYDTLNRLKKRTEPSGLVTTFTYYENTPLVSTKTVTDGADIHYTEENLYDENNILIQKIIDDGHVCRTQKITLKDCEPALHMPEIIEEWAGDTLISKVRLHYDKCAHVIRKDIYNTHDEKVSSAETAYDSRGRVIQETDPEGNVTTYTYDENNNLISQNHPCGRVSTKSYDSANRNDTEIETATDGYVRTTNHRYNNKNQRISTVNPLGYETIYTYDPFGNLTCTTHHDGSTEKATYDLLGNRITQTDPRGHTTTTTYNSLNSPLRIQYPDGSAETYTYYPTGKLKTHTNQDGDTLTYTYDALGRTTSIDHYGLATETFTYIGEKLHTHTDIEGITTTYEYDEAGRKISESRGYKQISYTYDTLGRLHQEIRLNGENTLVTAYSYDFLNQITCESQQDQYGHIILETSYTYDTQGNRITETTHDSTTRHTYDSFNRLIAEEDAEGYLTTIAYDEHYSHPIHGRTLRKVTTDPLQYRTIDTYDPFLRPIAQEIQDPQGATLFQEEYILDENGNCTEQKCHVYEDTNYSHTLLITKNYDSLNRPITVIEGEQTPEEKITHYTYTPSGKLATTEKPDNTLLFYTYDSFGNQTALSSSDGTICYTYTHTPSGHLLSSHDHILNTTTTRTLDQDGNIITETLANGLTLMSTYDRLSNRTKLTLPTKDTITYTYTPLYLHQVTAHGQTTTYSYDPAGNLQSRDDIHYTYNRLHRPTSLTSPLYTQSLTYDARGNVIFNKSTPLERSYCYDGLNQLISENQSTYTYDSYHNRRSKNDTPYHTNSIHALTSYGDTTCTHDANGNPIRIDDTHYAYDALDRLIQIRTPTATITYTYDSQHRRMTKNDTKYLYDNHAEIGAYTSQNTPLEQRVLGHSERDTILIILHGQTFQAHPDLHGNIIRIRSTFEDYSYYYNAFGEETPSTANPWRYRSKRHDSETNLIYFGQRYYNPETGRFLTPDPSPHTDTLNLYAYTYNNPLTYYDAHGLSSTEFGSTPSTPLTNNSSQDYDVNVFNYEAYTIRKHQLEYNKYINPKYLPPPPEPERSSIFQTSGDTETDRLIVNFNGICTNRESAFSNAQYIARFTGGKSITGVHAATFGFGSDLERYSLSMRNIVTEPIRLMQQVWDNYFQKASQNATILVIAHSRGAADLQLALATYDRHLRKRIYVLAIAPARYINPDYCGGVRHYRSTRDIVPLADPIGFRRYRRTVTDLTPHPDAPLFDHPFQSPTYKKTIKENINHYLTNGDL